jgi:hypothetical protein
MRRQFFAGQILDAKVGVTAKQERAIILLCAPHTLNHL